MPRAFLCHLSFLPPHGVFYSPTGESAHRTSYPNALVPWLSNFPEPLAIRVIFEILHLFQDWLLATISFFAQGSLSKFFEMRARLPDIGLTTLLRAAHALVSWFQV